MIETENSLRQLILSSISTSTYKHLFPVINLSSRIISFMLSIHLWSLQWSSLCHGSGSEAVRVSPFPLRTLLNLSDSGCVIAISAVQAAEKMHHKSWHSVKRRLNARLSVLPCKYLIYGTEVLKTVSRQ